MGRENVGYDLLFHDDTRHDFYHYKFSIRTKKSAFQGILIHEQ